ncbi:L-seryl-tRNA(Sec) kinase-like isoform X2 [Liolophura sinensis]|uniref:L-seryl-tRNA(Sec) kinase-like isoform X2 n=1 Tax=Liolophura sinensis TaxID=3198878 RepID=UPI0031596288
MDGIDSGVSEVKGCILVLCGLPASGKTILSKELSFQFDKIHSSCEKKCVLLRVSYDNILTQDVEQGIIEAGKSSVSDKGKPSTDGKQASSAWKNYRLSILNCVERLLDVLLNRKNSMERPDHVEDKIWENFRSEVAMEMVSLVPKETTLSHVVMVIDDNMYYSSMRYQYFQLARKFHIGFCQVYLSCDVEESVRRNVHRLESVQTQVITDMVDKFEIPDPKRNHWERNSVTLLNRKTPDLSEVFSLINSALENPIERGQEGDLEEQEESRVICSKSVLHQLDQLLRKIVAKNIEDAKGKLSKEELKNLAKKLNSAKVTLYSHLKTGSLQLPGNLTENVMDASKDNTSVLRVFMEKELQAFLCEKDYNDQG